MSGLVVPMLLLGCLLCGVLRGVHVYDAFLSGAREGLMTAWRILPALAAVMLAAAVLASGGAMDALTALLKGPLSVLGIPEGALPVMLLRPLSGSAALGMLETTLEACGPDSLTGRIASVMAGSSETILYTCTVYLGAAGVKNARHALPAALAAWLAGSVAAAFFTRIL